MKPRRASIIIEAVIAAALLATATVAVARFAQTAAILSQQADRRLSATLAAENTIQRLRRLSFEELASQSASVAQDVAEITGCDVKVQTRQWSSDGINGMHLRVAASASELSKITLHDWRIKDGEDDRQDTPKADRQRSP